MCRLWETNDEMIIGKCMMKCQHLLKSNYRGMKSNQSVMESMVLGLCDNCIIIQ